jgi:DNA modification methylase
MLKAGGTTIKAVYTDEVDPFWLKVFEFEENAKRTDLTWQEQALAILHYHDARCALDPEWTLQATADAMNISSDSRVSCAVQVARALQAGNEKVAAAPNVSSAYNIISRERGRLLDTELSQLFDVTTPVPAPSAAPSPVAISTESAVGGGGEYATHIATGETTPQSSTPTPETTIIQGDFTEWAPSYTGRKFNFLHCDFPYGVGHNDTEQGGSERWGSYADSEDVYWGLCEVLRDNLPKILFSSAHIMFWFSMNHYQRTVNFFSAIPHLVVQPFPLIWLKSDGKGIAPDVERQPRRVYETALLMSYGDRRLVKLKNNCYSGPCTKEIHISEKPEPMLRYFFEMFVDDLSEVLDPTCGSGTSIRAAESLKAKRTFGLELNPEYAKSAQDALRFSRNKAILSEMI